jgi:aminopeptidase
MDSKILEKYAKVMVNYAANSGNGIKKGDNVRINYPIVATPLGREIYKQVLLVGANPFVKINDERLSVLEYENATDEQLTYFPKKYFKSMIDTYDHSINIISTEDLFLLKDIDPKKIMLSSSSMKLYRKWVTKKEDQGKYTWTLCLYPTEAMAKEADLSMEEYWEQIIKACFLNEDDPVKKWKEITSEQNRVMDTLNKLPIDKINIVSEGTDLWITLGENRKWVGGGGCNIPSFEIFTSPDWRGTNGEVTFQQPLYYCGNVIKGIKLTFKDGKVIKAIADENEALLLEMIKQENADKIGEFSLTDTRFSKIDKFMAETLYDENFGGSFGNFHIALGNSYHDTYSGSKELSNKEYKDLGFNESVIHTDIVSTTNRVVTVILKDKKFIEIYSNGKFNI